MSDQESNPAPRESKEFERIGNLADKADNFVGASQIPLPDRLHKEQLAKGMAEISAELKEIYKALTLNNPWE